MSPRAEDEREEITIHEGNMSVSIGNQQETEHAYELSRWQHGARKRLYR